MSDSPLPRSDPPAGAEGPDRGAGFSNARSDPYTVREGGAVPPPTNWRGRLRYLGPSVVISGSIVGSGEIILTSGLGASAGFILLWWVLLSCWIKSLIQAELARYTLVSGDTYVRAMNRFPAASRSDAVMSASRWRSPWSPWSPGCWVSEASSAAPARRSLCWRRRYRHLGRRCARRRHGSPAGDRLVQAAGRRHAGAGDDLHRRHSGVRHPDAVHRVRRPRARTSPRASPSISRPSTSLPLSPSTATPE